MYALIDLNLVLRSLNVFIMKPKNSGKVVCISQLSPVLSYSPSFPKLLLIYSLKYFPPVHGTIYSEDRLIGESFMLRMCGAFDRLLEQSTGMK